MHPYKEGGTLSFAFQPKGYYYGPIGSYRDIPHRHDYRVVLQLRDPRDVLTSLYYSTAFGHALISQKLVEERKEALKLSLDDFVLRTAEKYRGIYEDYINELMLDGEVLFLRYEDMVADFSTWLNRLSQHCQLDHLTESLMQIEAEADFDVSKEDKYVKRRQVTPGEHARKLSSETVAALNTSFEGILRKLGYSESP